MSQLKLKKIFKKKEESEFLKCFLDKLNLRVAIYEENEIIFKHGELIGEKTEREVLMLNGLEIGYIRSNDKINIVINLLQYLINKEYEKKKLVVDAIDKYKEISIFYNLSEKLAISSDIRQVANTAFKEAKKYIKSNYYAMVLKDENTGKLILVYDNLENSFMNKRVLNLENKILQNVIDTGVSEIVIDLKENIMIENFSGSIKSVICSPLAIKNKITGAILIGNTTEENYSSEELKVFNTIAFQVSISIENVKLYISMEETFFQTVKALSETIEKRDPYTGGHTHRVMEYSILIGKNLELNKKELVQLRLAALMHDIGKIGVEDKVLKKPEKLTSEEFEKMKKHTEYGAEIIKSIKQLVEILPAIRAHHERFDGTGYPDGLKGEEIPLFGRIIAVADTFDAMITNRPYRKALNVEAAIEELKKNSGTQFDAKIVEEFLSIYKKNELYF